MKHTYLKNYCLICKICGDEENLIEYIREFAEATKAEYLDWLGGEEDDDWNRCDWVDSDCGESFEKWLKKEYPDLKIMWKVD
jgi:hypothetical protein